MASASSVSSVPSKSLLSSFFSEGILETFEPSVPLTIQYGDVLVDCGTQMEAKASAKAPHVSAHVPAGKGHYTLLMIDPDAPSPKEPAMRNWLHWLVTNIPGGDAHGGHIALEAGKIVEDYAKPTPPKGNHRYVFVLYKQATDAIHPDKPEARGAFDAIKFAHTHKLHPVGIQYYYVHAPDKFGGR